MKGTLQNDYIPVNKYSLKVIGLIDLTVLKMSGLEEEIETVNLPDRTMVSAGYRKPTEFTMEVPAHHAAEQAALELWYRESQDPVSPTYKKPCTLIMDSRSGENGRSFTLSNVWPKKRKMPDLDMANDGDLATIEWTMSVDDIIPI